VPILLPEEAEIGATLFSPGNPGDKVYLLMHGSITILKGKRPIATLSAEQGQATSSELGLPIFGYLAMVDRSPRTISAVAAADSKLLVLPLEQWAAAQVAMPDLKKRLVRNKDLYGEGVNVG
jgi:CRP-like cAMP-binding protein